MSYPADRQYTKDHEWIALDADTARVGLTVYAAEALGEAVFLEAPEVGAALTAGTACGEIESVKSVSDLVAPADGEVVEVNEAVVANAQLATEDPHGRGWLYTMKVARLPELLSADEYAALVREQQA